MAIAIMNNGVSSVGTFDEISPRQNLISLNIEKINFAFDDLISTVRKYAKPKSPNYNWKEDYAQALEEKYENIR